jgi:hypothetical protein
MLRSLIIDKRRSVVDDHAGPEDDVDVQVAHLGEVTRLAGV